MNHLIFATIGIQLCGIHVAKAINRGLRQRGVDVLKVPEANMLGASDEYHLAKAREENRVIFTQDSDFLRLASSGVDHSGIVYVSQRWPTVHNPI